GSNVVRALAYEGVSQRSIASQLGITRYAVGRVLAESPGDGAVRQSRTTRLSGSRRVTVDHSGWSAKGIASLLRPTEETLHHRTVAMDPRALERMAPGELLDVLADRSPEVSRALWDYMRHLMAGYEISAVLPGSEDPDDAGSSLLKEFMKTLRSRYGAADIPLQRLFMGAMLRGAMVAEIVFDDAGRTPLDLATPDPAHFRFKLLDDPVYGEVWQLGQWQEKEFVIIDDPKVRYLPIDPKPGSPYGRAPFASAVFPALFLLGLMHDLKRVISQQGYPRVDISIDLEALEAALPDGSPIEDLEALLLRTTDDVVDAIKVLEPDDYYVHSSAVNVNSAVGAVDSGSLGAVDGIIAGLERMCVRSLKTVPLFMGVADGVSEAYANRQWETHVKGVKHIQHIGENLLEHLLDLVLQAAGNASSTVFRFAELREVEEQRDELTLSTRLENAEMAERLGYMDRDEASTHAVGHPAVVAEAPEPEPEEKDPVDPAGETLPGEEADPDEAAERSTRVVEVP
ncbi:MAG: hypothetical protein WKF80_11970, partial [Thermomicrobiales bacterium]